MSSKFSIRLEGVSKCYNVFDVPSDRLKQFVMPKVLGFMGMGRPNYGREFWALRDVGFEVERGQSVGILGRNGSGKSTLLQIATGTLAQTAGKVETQGRVAALLELGSGFNPEYTGRDNVYMAGALQGFSRDQIESRFDEIASFADIGEFIDLPVKTYSSGMYARLAFASAIHSDPDVLIVDEILAVGDAPFQKKCINKLYGIMDSGVSILLVSHDAYQIRSICQKAVLLEKGRVKFWGGSDRAMDEYIASFGSREQIGEALKSDVEAVENSPEEPSGEGAAMESVEQFKIYISDVSMNFDRASKNGDLDSNNPVEMSFQYNIDGKYEDDLTFVINLYREDGVYVFGTTTKMQGLPPYLKSRKGKVKVNFPRMPLVAGKYNWRVAVNDGRGMGILAEAVPVCGFRVQDSFRAVGLVDIDHSWTRVVLE